MRLLCRYRKPLLEKRNNEIILTTNTKFFELRKIHSKSDNPDILTGFDTDETTEKFFESLIQRY